MTLKKDQAENTKKALMEASFKIIKEAGFSALSANKIAKEAGVSKGGIFHHFNQMEDLYLYMLDFLIAQFEVEIDPSSFKTFEKFMEASSKYTIQFIEQSPEVYTAFIYFIVQSYHREEYKKRIKALFEHSFSMWAQKMEHFFDVKLSSTKKEQLVRMIDMHFMSLGIHLLIMEDKKYYRNITKDFTKMIIRKIKEEGVEK